MRGIKILPPDFALKMQVAYVREGGGEAYLRDTTVVLNACYLCFSHRTRAAWANTVIISSMALLMTSL